MKGISLFLLGMLLMPQLLQAGESDRNTIVDNMYEFIDVSLETVPNDPDCYDCLHDNLLHDNYNVSPCSGSGYDQNFSSDIYWHSDFLNNTFDYHYWSGMPYSYGGNTYPSSAQGAIDDCKALGNHWCHYSGNNMNVSWAMGTDCSASVCWAAGLSRTNTGGMNNDAYGVVIEWGDLGIASYIVKSGSHVVLVELPLSGDNFVLESTGFYPVTIRSYESSAWFQSNGYTPRDFVDVANAQGSDGHLVAVQRGGSVELIYHIEAARNLRWIEFQYYDPDGVWRSFDQQDFVELGQYRSSYSGPGAEALVYRVRDDDWGGARRPRCETKAFAADIR